MNITEKPWGHEMIWAQTDKYVGKILYINKDEKLSLQYHKEKDETIMVLNGSIKFTCGDDKDNLEETVLEIGGRCHIKPGFIHRMEALEDDTQILEVSTPELDDVIRIEDNYGRSDDIPSLSV